MPDLAPMIVSQLGGCTEWIEFEEQYQLAQAVGALLGCHRHNFIVLPDGKWTLCVSEQGLECLQRNFPRWSLSST